MHQTWEDEDTWISKLLLIIYAAAFLLAPKKKKKSNFNQHLWQMHSL